MPVVTLLTLPDPVFAAIMQKMTVSAFARLHRCCKGIQKRVHRIPRGIPLLPNGINSVIHFENRYVSVGEQSSQLLDVSLRDAVWMNLHWFAYQRVYLEHNGIQSLRRLRVRCDDLSFGWESLPFLAEAVARLGATTVRFFSMRSRPIADVIAHLPRKGVYLVFLSGGYANFSLANLPETCCYLRFWYPEQDTSRQTVEDYYQMLRTAEDVRVELGCHLLVMHSFYLEFHRRLATDGFAEEMKWWKGHRVYQYNKSNAYCYILITIALNPDYYVTIDIDIVPHSIYDD